MSYIGRSSDGFGLLNKYRWVASGGETSIASTLTDSNNKQLRFTDKNLVTLFKNGTKLDQTAYNLNTANTISGLTALSASDIIEAHVFDTFSIATFNTVPTSGGTFTGAVNVSGAVTATSFSGDGSSLTNLPVTGMPTTGGTFTNDVVFATNTELKFGNSANFKITSNNTDGSILNYTGDIKIEQYANDKDIILSSDNSSGGLAEYIKCDGSTGNVYLYNYGNWRFNTNSSGVYVNGVATLDGDVTFTGANYNVIWDKSDNRLEVADEAKISFGSSNDLEIWHTNSGSNSLINAYNGDLYIQSLTADKDILIRADDGSGGTSTWIKLDGGTGEIDITAPGVVDINSSLGDINIGAVGGNTIISGDTGNMTLTNNGTGDISLGNFKFDSDQTVGSGQDNYVLTYDNSTAKISLEAASGGGMPTTGGTFTGDVTFSGDNYNVFWDKSLDDLRFAHGASIDLQTTSGGAGLRFYRNSDHSYIMNYDGSFNIFQGDADNDVIIYADDSTGGFAKYIQADGSSGETQLFHYGSEKLATKSTGVAITGVLTLGGSLDVNGNEISSASNNNVVVNPNGSGVIQLNASTTLQDGSHNFDVASHDGTNGLLLGGTLVTSSAAELNKLDGTSVTSTELDKLNGYTGTTAELNLLDLGTDQHLGIFKISTSVPSSASDFTGNTKIIMVY